MNDKDLGYICGIIDGEGTIYVSRYKYHGKVYYRIHVCIGNTSKLLINKCKDIFYREGYDTKVYLSKTKKGILFYRISLCESKKVLYILKMIYNSLISKREICQYAIKYLESRNSEKYSRSSNGRFDFRPYNKKEYSYLKKIDTINGKMGNGKNKRKREINETNTMCKREMFQPQY